MRTGGHEISSVTASRLTWWASASRSSAGRSPRRSYRSERRIGRRREADHVVIGELAGHLLVNPVTIKIGVQDAE